MVFAEVLPSRWATVSTGVHVGELLVEVQE
jgi:hypothetical protein